MFELIGKGENWHIVEQDPRLGSVPVANVRHFPEELERARALVDAANRDEERFIKQGQAVVQNLLKSQRQGRDSNESPRGNDI